MMPARKSKLWTMLFSLCPGAGHMFMGFMHLGLSYMLLFFGTISLMFFLDNISFYFFEFIGFLLPVIWCYAFFDCLNKCYAPDEEFYMLEDKFLFTDSGSMPNFHNFNFRLNRYVRLVLGWLHTISGCVMLLRNLMNMLAQSELLGWDSYIYRFIREVIDELPRFVGAIAIVALGLWLIFGKRRELKDLKSMMDQTEEEDYRRSRERQTPSYTPAPEDFSFTEGFQPPEDGKPSDVFKPSEIFKHPEEIQPTEEEKAPEIVLTLENEAAPEEVRRGKDVESPDKDPAAETAEPVEAPQPVPDTEDVKPLEEVPEDTKDPKDSEEAQRHE